MPISLLNPATPSRNPAGAIGSLDAIKPNEMKMPISHVSPLWLVTSRNIKMTAGIHIVIEKRKSDCHEQSAGILMISINSQKPSSDVFSKGANQRVETKTCYLQGSQKNHQHIKKHYTRGDSADFSSSLKNLIEPHNWGDKATITKGKFKSANIPITRSNNIRVATSVRRPRFSSIE